MNVDKPSGRGGTDGVRAWVVQPSAQAMPAAPDAPALSAARTVLLQPLEIVDEAGVRRTLQVPMERPLTVVLDGIAAVTLMTLGAAPELLVLGYLRNQRIIEGGRQVRSIAVDWNIGIAEVTTVPGVHSHAGVEAAIKAGGSSACALGTVFETWMREASDARGAPAVAAPISRATLLGVLDTMQIHDDVHRAAGSVHSCALFLGAELLVAIEDVSRHNGIDTIVGWMMQHAVDGAGKTLFTTGRLTAEMVMKAAYNGIRILVSRNGVTAMGYELATRLGVTLVARAAKRRFSCYVGEVRDDP